MPLHTFIADLVDSQGGSCLLTWILNRFGICASAETLLRFIQHKASKPHLSELEHFNPESLIIVSADNIDFLHSFARVFKGNQASSTHATSVQAVQPLPSFCEIGETDVSCLHSATTQSCTEVLPTTQPPSTAVSRKRPHGSSPLTSPQRSLRPPLPKSQ